MNTTTEQAEQPLVKTSYWLGKCGAKGCGNVVRVSREMRGRRVMHYSRSGNYGAYPKTEWSMIGEHPFYTELWCVAHKRRFRWECVNGKYSESHVCDSRCMGATGPNCECSCGGANHGGAYDLPKFEFKDGRQ